MGKSRLNSQHAPALMLLAAFLIALVAGALYLFIDWHAVEYVALFLGFEFVLKILALLG
jgi:hypothetical protein